MSIQTNVKLSLGLVDCINFFIYKKAVLHSKVCFNYFMYLLSILNVKYNIFSLKILIYNIVFNSLKAYANSRLVYEKENTDFLLLEQI